MTRKRETRGERTQRLAREGQAAQERGEWDPAPGGAGAAADREDAYERRERADAVSELQSAQEHLQLERKWLDDAIARGESDLSAYRRDVEQAEAAVKESQAKLKRLRELRQPGD
jgi:hypothetical protein